MTVGALKILVEKLIAKSNLGGYVAPADFNPLLQKANMDRFNQEYKKYEATQKVTDDLRPFVITQSNLGQVDSDRYIDLPADYLHISSARGYKLTNVDGSCTPSKEWSPIEMVTDDQWNMRENNAITKPTFRNPIGTIENNKFKCLPDEIGFVTMTYLKTPAVPNYDFNIGNAGPVYLPPGSTHDGTNPDFSSGDASTSVELEWPDQVHHDIAARVLQSLGVIVRSELIIQTAQEAAA